MKIRSGFVTNSSSSSFIAVFDKEPESIDEVQKILFGDSPIVLSMSPYVTEPLRSVTVACSICREIKHQKPNDIEKLQKLFVTYASYAPDAPKCPSHNATEEEWQTYRKERDNYGRGLFDLFYNQYKDKKIYVFTWGSEIDGYSAQLEEAEIFTNIPHFVVCNH